MTPPPPSRSTPASPDVTGAASPSRTDALRLRVLAVIVVALLASLGIALAYWQLIRSPELAQHGRRQTLRQQSLPVPRGVIYDRNGRVLVENRPRVAAVVSLGALRDEIQETRQSLLQSGADARNHGSTPVANVSAAARATVVRRHLDRIRALLGRSEPPDDAALERQFASDRNLPVVLADHLSSDEQARLTRQLAASDPIRLRVTSERTYPQHGAAAHVLGRVRAERASRTKVGELRVLEGFDLAGDSGVEKQFERRLRGQPGTATVRLDAAGYVAGEPIDVRPGSAGEALTLSLDLELQLHTERALASAASPRGSAVVLAVESGEILALASKPDFDLNQISPRISSATKAELDAAGAWFNRATQGLYPPGSLFKIVTTSAGLRDGALRPDSAYDCPGYAEFEGHRFVCHNPEGHGRVGLRTGLAQSCNVFAYQVGMIVGAEKLAREARRFHLAEPTAVDLPFETTRMLVGDPTWKRTQRGEPWTLGDTINLSIGQGDVRISPLQAACMMASLARRETLTVPTILHDNGRRPWGGRTAEPLELSDRDYAALIEGLEAVVQIGIGRAAEVPGVRIAGKSGTAQLDGADGRTNVAWFVAFAPIERPEIAIAVALEGEQPGAEFAGAAHAAPLVGEIAGAYFDRGGKR